MEVLPHQKTVSTSALRELYESKVAMQFKSVHQPKNEQLSKSGQQPKRDQQSRSSLLKSHNGLLLEDSIINHEAAEEHMLEIESESINNHVQQATPPKEEYLTPKVNDQDLIWALTFKYDDVKQMFLSSAANISLS